MKIKKIKKSSQISKEVSDFLQERQLMLKQGFPYCYVENFVPFHCKSCIEFFRKRRDSHKGEEIEDSNVF